MPVLRLCFTGPFVVAARSAFEDRPHPHPSELRRLYTENLALKAVNEVLRTELHRAQGKRKQGSQVFAYLPTLGNELFQAEKPR